ncbi:MAG TPA: hypothetical protein VHN11_04175 [Xanthobacteraceae bacterium]|jgi:hypothetical protein|nr:hypothetical protein [Xanthobacteraceae bacterium]
MGPRALRAAGICRRIGRVGFAVLSLGLALAGCVSNQGSVAGNALQPAAVRGPTVAFDSIDGPPVALFQKLVSELSTEAQNRQVVVVSREDRAAYRVRGYLAATVESGRTHIDWVWDVYDAAQQRTLRIVGAEAGNRRGGDAWAMADDEMVHKIARVSMDRLVVFLADPRAAPAGEPGIPARPAVPDRDAPAVAESLPPSSGVLALVAERP